MKNFIEDIFLYINTEKTWVAIAFCLFVYILYKPVKSILFKTLNNKISEIANKINSSDKITLDAKKSLKEMKILIKDLDNKAKEITDS